MIPIFLLGGFGNNMFQIALFFELMNRNNMRYHINTYFLQSNFITRCMGWDRHSDEMTRKVLSHIDRDFIDDKFRWRVITALISYVFLKLVWPDRLRKWSTSSNAVLTGFLGYYQNGEHLNTETYKKLSALVQNSFGNCILSTDTVGAIHARRGDFAGLENISFERQIQLLSDLIEGEGRVLIISDDSVAMRAELVDQVAYSSFDISVVSGAPETDFGMLLQTPAIICSPSSFCYWAFVLGKAEFGAVPRRLSNGQTNTWPYIKNVVYY